LRRWPLFLSARAASTEGMPRHHKPASTTREERLGFGGLAQKKRLAGNRAPVNTDI